ncbi:30S ribosomal protein S16 [Candidatus Saccharibacteria bacterium]|nr:30S ribosomal protein S16 [Candidatus Saccharibacteria bacterium]
MLAIRMQRTGRKGHAMFRVVVQDSRQTPTSGKVVAQLGHYDPHNKTLVVDKDKTTEFLKNGAQPSNRVAILIKNEGIKLPEWVKLDAPNTRSTKNTEKLRKNRKEEETATNTDEEKPPEVSETAEADKPAAEEVTDKADTEEADKETKEAPAETAEVSSEDTSEAENKE